MDSFEITNLSSIVEEVDNVRHLQITIPWMALIFFAAVCILDIDWNLYERHNLACFIQTNQTPPSPASHQDKAVHFNQIWNNYSWREDGLLVGNFENFVGVAFTLKRY